MKIGIKMQLLEFLHVYIINEKGKLLHPMAAIFAPPISTNFELVWKNQ
jgi:hypothetical protein